MRIKRSVASKKRRKNVLKHAKGFMWGRKSKYRLAKDAVKHAWSHAYVDRKKKKRTMRALWNIKINALLHEQGLNYSRFINALKKSNIELDRKVLSQLAETKPEIFNEVVKSAK